MREWIPAIFALTVAAAGWFYMFYSRAADRLLGIEEPRLNQRRRLLRKINGLFMLLLAVCFYALFYTIDRSSPGLFVLLMGAVFVLLLLILALALLDVRLTWKLRNRRRKDEL